LAGMGSALWSAAESLAMIGAGYLVAHGLGAASSTRATGAVSLVVLGMINPHAALAAAREVGLRGPKLLAAKLSFNSLPYLVSIWFNSLAILGVKVGGPYAAALTLVDVTEILAGAIALRGTRVEPPSHASWSTALRAALRSTARAAGYLFPGVAIGTLLAHHASAWAPHGAVLGAFLVNPLAGCSVLAGLMERGALSPREAYWVAILGAGAAYVGRLLRSCGPATLAVTGPRTGPWLSVATTLVDVSLLLAFGWLIGALAFG